MTVLFRWITVPATCFGIPAKFLICTLHIILCGKTLLHGQDIFTKEGIHIKEVWIPLSDGTRLAADLYLPKETEKPERLPVLLEYLPYRKDEGRGNRYPLFSYFVLRGYVVARVDIRGTGRSEGKLVDGEYSEQEQSDGEEVIAWLSEQNFSNGNVGMFGISWGGFNALHMAMRQPPALKAIISLMSTDDIYEDDVHFIDGMMHIDAYEIGQDLTNALPGAPDFIIDSAYFRNRFDTEPWLLKYKRQQNDGPFWNRASLNEDYTRIDVPSFIIGGWYDGYRDFVPRMLKNTDAPIKALLGPWNHTWPNWASPEPAMEWRDMAVRWFDHWLKDIDNGIMKNPKLYYFQRAYHEPGTNLTEIPGRWMQSESWPQTHDSLLYVQPNQTLATAAASFEHQLKYKPSVGIEASGSVMWWGDWAPDQTNADAQSLVYDSEPIKGEVAIIGFPEVVLQVSANAPAANWLVRLSDVAPDGKVTQITGAGFNGTHRNSSEKPEPLAIDSTYTLQIQLHATSWTFQKGHKIRLAINNAQWPMIWPTPYPMTTSLFSSSLLPSYVKLPLALPAAIPLKEPFQKPEIDPELPGYTSLASETLSGFAEVNEVKQDEKTMGTSVLATNSGSDQYPWGMVDYTESITHSVDDAKPALASVKSIYTITVKLNGRELVWSGELIFSSDVHHYYFDYTRRLQENGEFVRERNWTETIDRN